MAKKKTTFSELVKIMAKLRAPGGCPWDREQTHESLLKYLKEEAEEVVQAVKKNDMENLEEELGDILLQVLFHSNMARGSELFEAVRQSVSELTGAYAIAVVHEIEPDRLVVGGRGGPPQRGRGEGG